MRPMVTMGPSTSVTLSVLVKVYVVSICILSGLIPEPEPKPEPEPVPRPEDGMEPEAADPDPSSRLTDSADCSIRNEMLRVLTSTVSLNVRMRSSEVKLRV